MPDIEELLERAAVPVSSDPDIDQIAAGVRGRRIRRRVVAGAAGVVSVVAAVALFAGPLAPGPRVRVVDVASEQPSEPEPEPTDSADALDLSSVVLPVGWELAGDLTPNGGLPVLLSASTGPPLAGGDRCAQVPVAAIEALGPTDALLEVQHRADEALSPDLAIALETFQIPAVAAPSSPATCVEGSGATVHWIDVAPVGGPGAYVLIALGSDVTDERRSEVSSILYSLGQAVAATTVTSEQRAVVEDLRAFAADPTPETFADLRFGPEFVPLLLGATVHAQVRATDLAVASGWTLRPEFFAGRVPPFSALGSLADPGEVLVAAGPRRHCAGPPLDRPSGFEDLALVVVEPAEGRIDSCLNWYAVHVYLDDQDRIAGVGLDLWDP